MNLSQVQASGWKRFIPSSPRFCSGKLQSEPVNGAATATAVEASSATSRPTGFPEVAAAKSPAKRPPERVATKNMIKDRNLIPPLGGVIAVPLTKGVASTDLPALQDSKTKKRLFDLLCEPALIRTHKQGIRLSIVVFVDLQPVSGQTLPEDRSQLVRVINDAERN